MSYTPILPKLDWVPSPNSDDRNGHPVDLVVAHRWGASSCPLAPKQEDQSFEGVESWFLNKASQVSAHFVFPGSAGGIVDKETGQMFALQMVAYKDFAWAEAAYNPVAVEVEFADNIWLGADPEGMQVAARIIAFLCHKYDLPAVWSTRKGFCRHGDLGVAGGGHLDCPVDITTTDGLKTWKSFVTMVKDQTVRGDFEPVFGR